MATIFLSLMGVGGPAQVGPPTSGLLARWRADTGVTDAGAGKVSAWADMTANAYNLAQGTSGNQPVLTSNVVNSKPGIRFTGSSSNQLFRATTPALSQPFAFVVVVLPVGASPSFNDCIIADYTLGNFTQLDYGVFDGSHSKYGLYAGAGPFYTGSQALDTAAWVIGNFNGASSEIFVGGVSAATGNPSTGGIAGIAMGMFSAGTFPWNGYVLEALVYDHTITSGEKTTLATYMASQYGL